MTRKKKAQVQLLSEDRQVDPEGSLVIRVKETQAVSGKLTMKMNVKSVKTAKEFQTLLYVNQMILR